jgi:arylsulfatase A-like enzyme
MAHWPTYRGFDYFYGFTGSKVDYWNKTKEGVFDLFDQEDAVTDAKEIGTHNGLLLSQKAVKALEAHALSYNSHTPLFLYYAPALVHSPFSNNPAPFSGGCGSSLGDDTGHDMVLYCEMCLMLDSSVANLSCAVQRLGWADNTLMIVLSDNGGASYTPGSTYPLRGAKAELFNGGILGRAIVNSKLLPESTQGSVFGGLSHLTDWLPTLMRLATNGTWTHKFNGDSIDGVDLWDALLNCTKETTSNDSPRSEVLIHVDKNSGMGALIHRCVLGHRYYLQ